MMNHDAIVFVGVARPKGSFVPQNNIVGFAVKVFIKEFVNWKFENEKNSFFFFHHDVSWINLTVGDIFKPHSHSD